MDFVVDKSLLRNAAGQPFTQGLFLELGYKDTAVYTLKDDHHEHYGKIYPSLRRLYLECGDPTEYVFANTYLCGWRHWQRMTNNKVLSKYIEEWREELEVKLRAEGVQQMIVKARGGDSYQASKWLSDGGWDKRLAGRPSNEEKEKRARIADNIEDEYKSDVIRLFGGE